jgi:hypothetical protein
MTTYFKYAERNIDSQINWAEVGKNVVDMLREEDRLREEKKAAIDTASREFGETLSNAPTGDFQSANEWILGYAADASQARLLQDRLLKGGLLKVKDYTVARQNLNDGTNQMFQVAKEYQDKASEAMTRYQAGQSQDLEAWLLEQVEGLSNFKNTKAYINPTNYTVSLGMMTKKVVDGKEVMVMESDPDKFVTVNQLRNRMNVKLDKFDYVGSVDRQVNALGEFQTSEISRVAGLYKMASVKDVLDPMKRTSISKEDQKIINDYEGWEENSIKSQLANPYNQLSVLSDAIDKVPGTQDFYTFTFDPELAKTNKKYILLEDGGTGMPIPKFTEEQTKAATEFLRYQTRNALDRKTKIDVTAEPQPYPAQEWQVERGEKASKNANLGNMLGKLYSGSQAEMEAATQYLLGIPGVEMVERSPDGGVTVTKNGETKSFKFISGGNQINYNDWVQSLTNWFDPTADMNAVLRGAQRGSGGGVLNTVGGTSAAAEKMNVEQEFRDAIQKKFDVGTLTKFGDSEDSAVEYFNGIIGSLPGLTGYTAEGDGSIRPTSDGVIIKDAKGNKAFEFRFDGTITPAIANKYIQSLVDLSSKQTDIKDKFGPAQLNYNQKRNKGKYD